MGVVYVGRLEGPAGFERTVAIKQLHGHLAAHPEFTAMFLDEARLAARIVHPNVVATLDVVQSADRLLVVMDYVHGESLAHLARSCRERGERVPLSIAISIVVDVLYGLDAAHEATGPTGEPLGIVHRDVSPHNVMVGRDGVGRVLDFGIAKAASRISTQSDGGRIMGKLAYMAPEQLTREPADRRMDVFAVSIVLWELLTGERLFAGKSDTETDPHGVR
jgi:serine/threonine-protein kinase